MIRKNTFDIILRINTWLTVFSTIILFLAILKVAQLNSLPTDEPFEQIFIYVYRIAFLFNLSIGIFTIMAFIFSFFYPKIESHRIKMIHAIKSCVIIFFFLLAIWMFVYTLFFGWI